MQEAAGEEEARRLHSVTFAEEECDVREFVTDKDLVSWGYIVLSNIHIIHVIQPQYPAQLPSIVVLTLYYSASAPITNFDIYSLYLQC